MNQGMCIVHKKILSVTCVLVTFFLLSACSGSGSYTSTDFLMDTIIKYQISGSNAQEIYQQSNRLLTDFDLQYSMYQPESDISQINDAAGSDFVQVSPSTYALLQQSVALCEQSGGKFDITVGPLSLLWDVSNADPQVPNVTAEILSLINYKDILFREEDHGVMLAQPGQKIDLGGLAKGVACDQVTTLLDETKPESALIAVGSNIVGFGKNDFTIGIQDPRNDQNIVGSVPLGNQAIATSGDYQRFFEMDGQRYHHILDPKTGYPAQSDFMSMTVLARDGISADYLSTLLFMTSLEDLKPLRSDEDYSFIAIDHDKNVYVSDQLKGKFILNDASYTLQP